MDWSVKAEPYAGSRPPYEKRGKEVTSWARGDQRTDDSRKERQAMLSAAMQTAHVATLLDRQGRHTEALDFHGDTCDLLQQVIDRNFEIDDKQKLESLRDPHLSRVEELVTQGHKSARVLLTALRPISERKSTFSTPKDESPRLAVASVHSSTAAGDLERSQSQISHREELRRGYQTWRNGFLREKSRRQPGWLGWRSHWHQYGVPSLNYQYISAAELQQLEPDERTIIVALHLL